MDEFDDPFADDQDQPQMDPDDTAGDGPGLDPGNLLLIVTGAHLRAEQADRPLAQRLQKRIETWVHRHDNALDDPLLPVSCCDLWYLNQPTLQRRPTISIGGPGVNALSAYFYRRLDPALVRDKQLIIQLDPEFVDLRVCLWGPDHQRTAEALEIFMRRFLDGFLRAVATQVEPQID